MSESQTPHRHTAHGNTRNIHDGFSAQHATLHMSSLELHIYTPLSSWKEWCVSCACVISAVLEMSGVRNVEFVTHLWESLGVEFVIASPTPHRIHHSLQHTLHCMMASAQHTLHMSSLDLHIHTPLTATHTTYVMTSAQHTLHIWWLQCYTRYIWVVSKSTYTQHSRNTHCIYDDFSGKHTTYESKSTYDTPLTATHTAYMTYSVPHTLHMSSLDLHVHTPLTTTHATHTTYMKTSAHHTLQKGESQSTDSTQNSPQHTHCSTHCHTHRHTHRNTHCIYNRFIHQNVSWISHTTHHSPQRTRHI